jgi:hypothetical protein
MSLFDDRPCMTLSLGMAEGYVLRDALMCANFAAEGNWEGLAIYMSAHSGEWEGEKRDALHALLCQTMEPHIRRSAAELRALMQEHSDKLDRWLAEEDG